MAVKLNTFHLETLFGGRSLLRDNWLCERVVKDLRRHEKMTEEEIDSLRMVSLHRNLVSAISKLPYYRKIPNRFPVARSIEVLQQYFPIITKQTLLENRDKLYPNAGKPRPWNSIGKTSGTTGTPLSVFRNPKSVLVENAFLRRHWEWGGYQHGMPRATLRGEMIVPLDRTAPPFWFWNRTNF
jgi:phenylacetate-CoA ligase